MRKASAARALLLLTIFFLTLEACARIDDYVTEGAPLLSPYNEDTLYTYDALGKRGKPYAHYLKWRLNSLGYRGPEPQSGRVRIACIGSSETFGLYESPEKEYPRQLEQELNARAEGKLFEVVNVAYPGLTLSTMNLRLPEMVEKLRPKVAVIYPSFQNYIVPPQKGGVRTPPPAQHFELRILHKIDPVVKAELPTAVQTAMKQFLIQRAARKWGEMARVPERNVERFRSDLDELIMDLEKHGVQPILVTHATRFGTTVFPQERPFLVGWRKQYFELKEEGFLDMERRMNEVVRATAIEQRLLLIDAASEIPPGNRYFADHAHFTDEGAQLMARILAERVLPAMAAPARNEAEHLPPMSP